MLRQSLKTFLKSLSMFTNFKKFRALRKIKENDFHKRLRNELIMLPIPKTKFNARKVPSGVSLPDFEDEIFAKQTHILQNAISRVSLTHVENVRAISPEIIRKCNYFTTRFREIKI